MEHKCDICECLENTCYGKLFYFMDAHQANTLFMCVNLAAQILSSTMNNVLLHYGGDIHHPQVITAKSFFIVQMFIVQINISENKNRSLFHTIT